MSFVNLALWHPNKFFLAGALTLASVLLYPKTLGGGAVLSGWVPFSSSVISQFPEEAKKVFQFSSLTLLINIDFFFFFFSVTSCVFLSLFRIVKMQTPILWSHGTDDKLVLFEAGQAALPFLRQAGVACEFKVENLSNFLFIYLITFETKCSRELFN